MEGYDGYGYDQQKPRFLRCFRYHFVSKKIKGLVTWFRLGFHPSDVAILGIQYLCHWIGLRENLNRKPWVFTIKYRAFRLKFSHHPIQYLWRQQVRTPSDVNVGYPLVMSNSLLLKMTIERVDLPIKNGGSFHSYVKLPEGKPMNP